MSLPIFVIKNQDCLLVPPQGIPRDKGVGWIFQSPKGEVSVNEFDGTFGTEYVLSYPSDEDPREYYGIEYDPYIHGDIVYKDESTSDPRDIENALEVLLEPQRNKIDFVGLFPDLRVSKKQSDWVLEDDNTKSSFLLRQGSDGFNVIFISPDNVALPGGPFETAEEIKKFVEISLQSLLYQSALDIPPEKKEPESVLYLRSAMEKIMSACDDTDQAGEEKITDALVTIAETIKEKIEESDNEV